MTIQLEIITAPDDPAYPQALAAVRRLLEVLRAEYPGVTVVYPPGVDVQKSGGKRLPLYGEWDMKKMRPFI